jgi:hypothetical protein
LQVPNNNLVGTIPIEIGDLTQLNLSNNPGISGSIPAEIGSLSQLSTMYLHVTAGTGNQCLTGATAAFRSWLTSKDATWQNDCADTDGDTTPNYLDPDDDGDGAPTAEENPEPNSHGDPTDAHDTDTDTDTDTIPDYLDANGGVDCSNAYGIPQAQCDYLVAAHTATNGATWRTNTGWTTHDSPCRWQGVTCSGGNVTIPTNIGDLTGLAILNLTDNEISGTIPTALTTITTLHPSVPQRRTAHGPQPPRQRPDPTALAHPPPKPRTRPSTTSGGSATKPTHLHLLTAGGHGHRRPPWHYPRTLDLIHVRLAFATNRKPWSAPLPISNNTGLIPQPKLPRQDAGSLSDQNVESRPRPSPLPCSSGRAETATAKPAVTPGRTTRYPQ